MLKTYRYCRRALNQTSNFITKRTKKKKKKIFDYICERVAKGHNLPVGNPRLVWNLNPRDPTGMFQCVHDRCPRTMTMMNIRTFPCWVSAWSRWPSPVAPVAAFRCRPRLRSSRTCRRRPAPKTSRCSDTCWPSSSTLRCTAPSGGSAVPPNPNSTAPNRRRRCWSDERSIKY